MSADEVLRESLHVPFGNGYDIPPPTGRVALRVRKFTSAIMAAREAGTVVDLPALLRDIGVDPESGYDPNVDLLGRDRYEEMLDDLTAGELDLTCRAMGVWAMPGATRELAEASLADPIWAPAKPNRAARRAVAKRATSPGGASKNTGTT